MKATTTIPVNKMLFFRSTSRWGKLGTISRNKGFMSVARDPKTGRFVKQKG